MRLSVYKAPRVEPIHLTEAKMHLRIKQNETDAAAFTTEDNLISAYIAAARKAAEDESWHSLVLRTYDYYLDEWPERDEIVLPGAPLLEVVHVKYTDSDGTETTFTDYTADTATKPGRVVLNYNELWPTATLAPKNPIHIRFKSGHLVPFTAAADTDLITATDHPYSDGDMVRLSVSGGSLPAGLSANTDYYVRDVSGDTLKLAASSGGDAIDITDTGTGTFFIGEIPAGIRTGMLLLLTDLYEERADTIVGKTMSALPAKLPRGASYWFAQDAVKTF